MSGADLARIGRETFDLATQAGRESAFQSRMAANDPRGADRCPHVAGSVGCEFQRAGRVGPSSAGFETRSDGPRLATVKVGQARILRSQSAERLSRYGMSRIQLRPANLSVPGAREPGATSVGVQGEGLRLPGIRGRSRTSAVRGP